MSSHTKDKTEAATKTDFVIKGEAQDAKQDQMINNFIDFELANDDTNAIGVQAQTAPAFDPKDFPLWAQGLDQALAAPFSSELIDFSANSKEMINRSSHNVNQMTELGR